ncbi:MAG: hypothetical protein ABH827_04195, partial [bacterium]
MKFSRKNLLLLMLCFIFATGSLHAIDVKNLKGTTLEFSDEFKQQCLEITTEKIKDPQAREEQKISTLDFLEIISQGFSTGALWWETYLLKKYYVLGDERDDTIKLIQSLFHEVQGSFGVTGYPAHPGYHISAKLIGKIIG